ncbi:MAG: ATP-binding protein [Nitrospirota bacterium]|nr:ATP-binding protein [Nitrospirota bacterium]
MDLLDLKTYSFGFRSFLLVLLGVETILLGSIVLVREKWSRSGFAFWLYTAPLALWLFSFGLAAAALDYGTAHAWYLTGATAILFIPSMVLFQAMSLANREQELRRFFRLTVAVAVAFLLLMHFTHLFLIDLQHFSWGWYPRYGWPGYLFVCYFAAVGGRGMSVVHNAYRTSKHPRNRDRLRLVLFALSIGFLAAVDFAPSFGLNVYPFGYIPYAVNFALTAWIIKNYRLMDIRPDLMTNRVLETMRGAVIVTDLEGKVRVVNEAATELLGRQRDELVGRDLSEVVTLPPVTSSNVRQGVRTGPHESVWTGPQGRKTDVSLWASPIVEGRDNAPVGTVYVAHDITERRRAEERLLRYSGELRQANRRLEDLDRLKSEFVSTVSHELRTPLTSIKAFAELLLIKPNMAPERKEKLLRRINDESDRLGRLISDLLDLSRIEAGTMTWRPGPVSAREVVEASVEGMLLLAQAKGLRIETDISEPLPALYGDRDRLVQVMTNLLSNAVKFTPPGGAISVQARAAAGPQSRVELTVTDAGAGIPAEDLPHIFDKFHRAGNAEYESKEGTGLGLTIARQIIAYHDGTISVASKLGQGSAFTVTLPAVGPDKDA